MPSLESVLRRGVVLTGDVAPGRAGDDARRADRADADGGCCCCMQPEKTRQADVSSLRLRLRPTPWGRTRRLSFGRTAAMMQRQPTESELFAAAIDAAAESPCDRTGESETIKDSSERSSEAVPSPPPPPSLTGTEQQRQPATLPVTMRRAATPREDNSLDGEGVINMQANMEEMLSRKGGKSKMSYPQPPSYDYLDSRSVAASILRHKLRTEWARTPPRRQPSSESMRAASPGDLFKRKREDDA